MKKFCFMLSAVIISTSAYAQTFGKGDMVVDLGIGVGAADNVNVISYTPVAIIEKSSGATFTQKFAFEYGVAEFGKSSIGVGLLVDNAYGASYDALASGSYDYTYSFVGYRYQKNAAGRYRWEKYMDRAERRKGVAFADATYAIDNVDFMVKGSFHHQFIDNLDTYATLGLGASVYKLICSPDESAVQGVSEGSSTLDSSQTNGIQLVYSYNDMDHVKWNGTKAKARFAMAIFVGARYYLTPKWAINAEIGLTSASFKKDANTYNILSIGASYKF